MRILLVVQPERFDFYNYLSKDHTNEYVLLWYEQESQMKLKLDELPLKFSNVYYWTQFSTPGDVFNEINPDKIVFFEIIDLRQIALIVTANAIGITTFYLEHGAAGSRETAILRWNEVTFTKHKIPYLVERFRKDFKRILLSKIFYYSVVGRLDSISSTFNYLTLPFKMLFALPNKVLSKNTFRERVPKYSIVFNQINFDEYSCYTGIKKDEAVLTGVPFFDDYYNSESDTKKHWVFIDHPYCEENLNGWTKEHHAWIASLLFHFANKYQIKLYIKLHPRSNPQLWQGYENKGEFIEILQYGNFNKLYLQSELILAFSSSLVTGLLCARKNIVLLGWHPEPSVFGMDFSKTGLCHLSMRPDELEEMKDYWLNNNLCEKNEDNYNQYIKELNYPFDGKATERVIHAINNL